MDTGGQSLHILPEPLNHIRLLLRHNPNPPIHWRSYLITFLTQKTKKFNTQLLNKNKESKQLLVRVPGALVANSAEKADWDGGGGRERRLGKWDRLGRRIGELGLFLNQRRERSESIGGVVNGGLAKECKRKGSQ